MTASELKTVPCQECDGPPEVYGVQRYPRSVFYLTDRVEVRCNNIECGHTTVIMKEPACK